MLLALSSLIFEDGTITWFSENEVFLEKSKTVLDKMSDLLKYNKSKICKFKLHLHKFILNRKQIIYN